MKRLSVVLLIVALLCSLVLLASCAKRGSEPVDRKMMIVGIDGLEWDIAGPMIEAGRLPHLAKLIHEGTWGEIRSLEKLESPIIWTSIATGKLPEKHGVLGFTLRPGPGINATGEALITSKSRKVKTIWQILGITSRTVGVVNWLVTWPAEPVNGYMVADYFGYQWEQGQGGQEGMTFPPELADTLAPLRVKADDVSDDEVARFVTGAWKGDEKIAAKLRLLKANIAADETARAVGLELARTRPVDLFAVYLRGLDGISHHFWVAAHPDAGPPVDPAEVRAFGETIEKYYEFEDEILGDFLSLAGEGWTVIVTSDHGFSGPKLRGDAYSFGIWMHDPTGVVVLWGKDIAGGRKLADPSVLDVTPTILALYGLPVADDMDGRVWTEAIDPAFLEAHPVGRIESYEGGETKTTGDKEPAKSSVDDEVKERLRSLGYIK
jgi:predicted AlkP superfamily phosphohydrolase/phosphomutase